MDAQNTVENFSTTLAHPRVKVTGKSKKSKLVFIARFRVKLCLKFVICNRM